eukprot:EG_transcript_27135
MAKDTAKKAHKTNQERLQLYLLITVGINVLFIAYRVWWHRDSFGILLGLGFILLVAGEIFALQGLKAYAEPALDDQGRVESCADLTAIEGMTSYLQDLLWVSWFVQATTMLSDWFWVFYAVIPAYGGYVGYTNVLAPVLAMRSGLAAGQAAGPAGAAPRAGSRAERRKAAQEEARQKNHPQKAKPRPRAKRA